MADEEEFKTQIFLLLTLRYYDTHRPTPVAPLEVHKLCRLLARFLQVECSFWNVQVSVRTERILGCDLPRLLVNFEELWSW